MGTDGLAEFACAKDVQMQLTVLKAKWPESNWLVADVVSRFSDIEGSR
jgi:hypothetical protein